MANVDVQVDGFWAKRIPTNPREKAFAEQWKHENQTFGGKETPLLQLLFVEGGVWDPFAKITVLETITGRDAKIAATLMQWLGSNIGMSFLEESLKKCGYRIVKN